LIVFIANPKTLHQMGLNPNIEVREALAANAQA
jgi:hypothetical protein